MAPSRREPVRANYKSVRSAIFTLVLLVRRDLFRRMLDLQKQLNTLDGGDGRLGDSGRDTTGEEVLGERKRIGFLSGRHFSFGYSSGAVQEGECT